MDDVREIAPPSAAVQNYLQEQDLAKAAAQVNVPTDDGDVQRALEAFGEPRVLAKEDKADRRARLTTVMAVRVQNGKSVAWESTEPPPPEQDAYWTDGPEALRTTRKYIAEYAAPRCAERLARAHKAWNACNGPKRLKILEKEVARRQKLHADLQSIELFGTQSGFARPVSCVRFNSTATEIATGDWSGTIKVVDEKLDTLHENQLHTGKATLAWTSSNQIVSGGEEGSVVVSDSTLKTLAQLEGHEARVARVDIHPSQTLAVSASYDATWRLWDLATSTSLLVQEGHSREVSTVKCHPDGALVVSAGLDGLGRVWDLRSGEPIMLLDGHAREIHCCDISPNGYEIATGSADNSVRIWDLRQVAQSAWIPAHTSVVTDLQFAHGGDLLVTCGYDQRVRLWSTDDWKLRHSLDSSSRLMSVDFAPSRLIAGRWDRCIDLFSSA